MEKKLKIFIVDDETLIRQLLTTKLKAFGEVTKASSEKEAFEKLKGDSFDIAFVDLNLSDSEGEQLGGLEIIEACSERRIPTIVLTGHDDKEIIKKAYQRGAQQYFLKGDFLTSGNLSPSLRTFLRGLAKRELAAFGDQEFITHDRPLREKISYIINQFSDDLSLLLTGPTGVGKTTIAGLIHSHCRPQGSFVSKNLTEISENLLESELFGHVKGAFTGAVDNKVGLIERANGGTLFLDEIGALPLKTQQKLLKVLEEKRVTPLGSEKEKKINFCLMTASCEDLGKKVQEGEMRVDFYFRLKGLELYIPPLKERRADINPLIDYFSSSEEKKIMFSDEALECLKKYDWPGNIRELRSLVKPLLGRPHGFITQNDLPQYIQDNRAPFESLGPASDGFLSAEMIETIEEKGLPALVKQIESEALRHAQGLHGERINSMSRYLKVSKSLFYRIRDEMSG